MSTAIPDAEPSTGAAALDDLETVLKALASARRPKPFSDRYAADGIRMNNVLPGFIDSLPEREDRAARIPVGRHARVEELSEVIAFLVSDRSSYVTDQNLRVDGGLTRSV